MTSSDLPNLHPEAVGLSAIRALPGGAMRQYSSVEFTRGWSGVEHFLRQLRACGFVRPSNSDTSGYAVLDVLDAEGDIIQDYDLPTAIAFRYVKRKLNLIVVPEPGTPQRPPTPGQLAELHYALRHGRIATLRTRRGRLPQPAQRLEQRGWITEAGQLTDIGRAVAERYELVEGVVREIEQAEAP
ncbi:hypothetical protein [Micromonospora sp. NPDC049662]|uniref:hypothetical protein n=1 Tax=Micromonospora sp. NPDC049662 TaxID=3155397 RepID=UPI003422993E